jgi:UDP-glucose-4-epimerase GalE
MTRVLVTGAAGYIGSHACKALAHAGFEPIGIDNLSRAGRTAIPGGPLIVADIKDRSTVDDVLETYQPVAALHFAAYAYVGESVLQPTIYYRNNVVGSLTLLEALISASIDKIVFSSTCATYGIPLEVPIAEDHPQAPINPYGSSKLMIERMLADFDAAHGVRHVTLRYFNAAGADPEGELGECHDPETHAVPLAIEAALGRRAAFEIFGSDYPTADGTAIRDYVHVTDLVDAHVRALRYLLDGGTSLALNLGTGQGHSVRQLLDAVTRVTGATIPVLLAPRRAGDPPVLVANPQLARSVLGWRAGRDLSEIVRTAVAWHRRLPGQSPRVASGGTA